MTIPPKPRFKIGVSCQYFAVEDLAATIGTSEKAIRGLCAGLEIPVLHFPGHPPEKGYVLLYALESALFGLGMNKKIRATEGLLRTHQELAGVMYGTLTKEALVKRVKMLAKELTEAGSGPKIHRKKERPKHWRRDNYTTFGGVDPR